MDIEFYFMIKSLRKMWPDRGPKPWPPEHSQTAHPTDLVTRHISSFYILFLLNCSCASDFWKIFIFLGKYSQPIFHDFSNFMVFPCMDFFQPFSIFTVFPREKNHFHWKSWKPLHPPLKTPDLNRSEWIYNILETWITTKKMKLAQKLKILIKFQSVGAQFPRQWPKCKLR